MIVIIVNIVQVIITIIFPHLFCFRRVISHHLLLLL